MANANVTITDIRRTMGIYTEGDLSINNGSKPVPVQLAYASTVNYSVLDGAWAYIELTGNVTDFNITDFAAGDAGLIYVYQDGTGGRTITFDAVCTPPTGGVVLSSGAGELTVIGWSCINGTSVELYYQQYGAAALPPAQLDPPTNFTTTVISSTEIDLDWDVVVGATSYTLDRSPNGSSSWTNIYTGATSAYNNTGLTASTQYFYRVKATASGLTDSGYATDNDTTTSGSIPALSTPTLTATVISSTQIDLSWTNVANESSYKLEWSPNGTTGWTQIGGTIAANTTTYSHTGLTASTLYYYRVSAIGDGVTYSDSGYGTDSDTTSAGGTAYLTWVALSASHEQITSSQGIRKLTGGTDEWGTTSNITVSNETIATGERVIWKTGTGANKSLAYIVSLGTSTATLGNSAPGLPFGVYMGYGLGAVAKGNEGGSPLGSDIDATIDDDGYFCIFYDGANIKYQTSPDATAWTTQVTSAGTPSGTYRVQFQPYSAGGGPIQIWKA